MNEKSVRQKLYRILRESGDRPITTTNTYVCPRCHYQIRPSIGRPDVIVPRTAIEVKALRLASSKSFSFGEIDESQRRWLDSHAENGDLGFICLGVIGQRGSMDCLVDLFLVEWREWLKIEERVRPFQKSIPYQFGKGTRRALEGLDLLTLAAEWRITDSIPESHPAHR